VIVIDKILISDEIIEEQFVCDLNKCKGGCCEDGDSGAPLATEELEEVKKAFELVKPFLTTAGLKELERTGLYRYDREFGWVTPTVNGEICAYGFRDKKGIIKCAFEEAWNQKLISWKKPISCHLYPIRTSKSKYNDYQMMNYEPRETLCSPACELGKELKVPVYQFLKESITRKFGPAFYKALEKIASELFEKKK
jgi:hypothetical protein